MARKRERRATEIVPPLAEDTEEMVDETQVDETQDDESQVVETEEEAPDVDASRKMAELESEIARLSAKRIDPRTNQPLSDFEPVVEGKDAQRSLELARQARRSGSLDAQHMAAVRQQEAAANTEVQRAANAEALENANRANVLPQQEMSFVPPELYRAREQARVAAEAAAAMSNVTIPGGKFKVNGELVNSYGDLIDEDGTVLEKRHRPISG